MSGPAPDRPPLEVTVHEPFAEEKKYSLDVMLSLMLGFECRWTVEGGAGDCVVAFPRGCRIRIIDAFFGNDASAPYAKAEKLPGPPRRLSRAEAPEGEVVTLFGDPIIEEREAEIILHADLVASAFFLLSRWEESIIEARDRWGRIPDSELYVRKHELDERPLVNEYARFIARIAEARGESIPPCPTEYALVPTHDIDRLYLQGPREIFGQAVAHRMPKRLLAWLLYRLLRVDQAAVIRRIMDMSEAALLKSRFYVMSGGIFPFDLYYRPEDEAVRGILREIVRRGHIIGFHPSFSVAEDEAAWRAEKAVLEGCVGKPIRESRQHYLKVLTPRTQEIWAANGIACDSSFGFSRKNGFRCGTGCAYPLFDLERGVRSSVIERPLVVMDAAIRKGEHREADKLAATRLISISKKYRMPCTILFHNHFMDPVPWNGLRAFFEGIMSSETRRG
jgi:hypothetical protein